MRVFADQLYGGFTLPPILQDLVGTAEVQRLRGIRLLNTSSPTLASLSDVRRYTHSLGVAHLASQLDETVFAGLRPGARGVLEAALLAHDLATPPFGHVYEYQLRASTGWRHEAVVRDLIYGTHRPENQYHQLLPGTEISFGSTLRKHSIDPDEVASIIDGGEMLGPFVSGSIDLDNIDNIWRMATHLGIDAPHPGPKELVQALRRNGSELAILPEAVPLLDQWADLRRRVYRLLAFEPSNLQGQAMLTDCITEAMQSGLLGAEHWHFTDEWLLYFLIERNHSQTAERFLAGDLFQSLYIGWYDQPQGDDDLRSIHRRREMRDALTAELGVPITPYVFYDNGTFSKNVRIAVEGRSDAVTVGDGTRSKSTIVGIFTSSRRTISHADRRSAASLEAFGLLRSSRRELPAGGDGLGYPGQAQLPL